MIIFLGTTSAFSQESVSNLVPVRKAQKPAQGSLAPVSGGTKPSTISLDIKSMEIVDVLKMLALRAEINIVIGKNIKGTVSMLLKDVKAWDAFEIIILSNNLAYEYKNGIINVMTQNDYESVFGVPYEDKKKIAVVRLKYAKAKDLVQSLTQIKSDIGKVVLSEPSNSLILMDTAQRIQAMRTVIDETDLQIETEIFDLNYADAAVLSKKINGMLTKGLGAIEIDERTDKIAVTDTAEKIDEIAKLVCAFDERPLQVLIDARIIELKPSNKFEMGIDWDYWMEKYFRIGSPFAGVSGETKLSIGTINATVDAKGDYKAVVDILQTFGDTKVLSSPRIMAINGEEARMLVGSKEAYLTSSTTQVGDSASTSESVNFVDVGIKLYVTPEINKAGFVTMKIRPEVSSSELVNFGTATVPKQIPIVTTSEAETTIIVKDGTTIIIGGLRKDEKIKTVKKVPILGDIPIINMLVRNISDETTTTDLVILLTPHIITGDTALTDLSELKPVDGVVIEMTDGEINKTRINPDE